MDNPCTDVWQAAHDDVTDFDWSTHGHHRKNSQRAWTRAHYGQLRRLLLAMAIYNNRGSKQKSVKTTLRCIDKMVLASKVRWGWALVFLPSPTHINKLLGSNMYKMGGFVSFFMPFLWISWPFSAGTLASMGRRVVEKRVQLQIRNQFLGPAGLLPSPIAREWTLTIWKSSHFLK